MARDDSFPLEVAFLTGNVLDNDDRGDPPATVQPFSITLFGVNEFGFGVMCGTLTISSDGSYSLDVVIAPADATCSADYTISNSAGSSTATLTFTT